MESYDPNEENHLRQDHRGQILLVQYLLVGWFRRDFLLALGLHGGLWNSQQGPPDQS